MVFKVVAHKESWVFWLSSGTSSKRFLQNDTQLLLQIALYLLIFLSFDQVDFQRFSFRKLDYSVQIASKFAALLLECFRSLSLNTQVRHPDIIEAGVCLVDVQLQVFPSLYVEAREHFGWVPNNDPIVYLCDVFLQGVGLVRLCWVLFKTDRAHVVVVAVVDVRLRFVAKTSFQIKESVFFTDI